MHSHSRSESILSDEEVVLLAKSGDSRAANEIVTRMYPLAYYAAESYSGFGLEKADLIQEAMLGLISAVRTFDTQKSTRFKTYANSCISNHLSSVLRRQNQKKQIPQEKLTSIDNLSLKTTVLSPEEQIIQKEQVSDMMRRLNQTLSDFEKQILIQYLSGYSAAEIADTLGINVKRVSNALYRIRQKFHSLIK